MRNPWTAIRDWVRNRQQSGSVGVDDLLAYAGQTSRSPWQDSVYDGGKYFGGFGPTQVQWVDYWALRARSAQLFTENLYARGIVRRLVTNEINTGLTPEACPREEILGLEEDSLADWTEDVETRFELWADSPLSCDWLRASTFGALQRAVRMEALVSGDVLVVLRQSRQTKLPVVQLIRGELVQTPLDRGSSSPRAGSTITQGVERDQQKRAIAYWTTQPDGTVKRIPTFGEKSGRRIAWLVYGTDKRMDDVRGQPLLSLVLQSLKEIDRYRDSAQRKAVINSILALFIKKGEDKPGTLPVTGGAVRRGTVTPETGETGRTFDIAEQIPGLVMEELQTGEEPVAFGSQGTDTSFRDFEAAILYGVAWALEMPPEILTLTFTKNYSASQAAINEFKIRINLVWGDFGETFCTPIYNEWLLSETLLGNIAAPGLLEAWRDPTQYDIFGAWTAADWYGSVKPSTDMVKQAKGSQILVSEGWATNAMVSRTTTGTKFTQNIKRLRRENELKAAAAKPLLELKKEFGSEETSAVLDSLDNVVSLIEDAQDGTA